MTLMRRISGRLPRELDLVSLPSFRAGSGCTVCAANLGTVVGTHGLHTSASLVPSLPQILRPFRLTTSQSTSAAEYSSFGSIPD